jgi:hypothetical protein
MTRKTDWHAFTMTDGHVMGRRTLGALIDAINDRHIYSVHPSRGARLKAKAETGLDHTLQLRPRSDGFNQPRTTYMIAREDVSHGWGWYRCTTCGSWTTAWVERYGHSFSLCETCDASGL